jgi:hypothetical protein
MKRLLDTTASTKRTPTKAGGKTGVPVANLASVSIVNPMPVDPEMSELYQKGAQRSTIDAARRVWATYADTGADIQAGDLMTVTDVFTDGKVLAVGPWPADLAFIEIIVSE